ncbi:hypothetical protein RND71_038753 [Anisodus tanguticus]|uniref:Alpha/beta hydrolase fold-3 domain-containing protein n=1 Tax=Anisodus tanguticus TaxID=243964 RepID=A0AAE1UTT5_9SOLA|nr:hypothetical protein RND71_038753 [Anisodus tanguticus]
MGVKPNSVTLLGLFLARSHVCLVDEAYSYFEQARTQDANLLKSEHYACMVDLLSRSGRFQQAEKFIQDFPFDPEPGDVSSYVMLSNAHSAAGRWQSVSIVRNELRDKGLKTVPGYTQHRKENEAAVPVHLVILDVLQHRLPIAYEDWYSALEWLIKNLEFEPWQKRADLSQIFLSGGTIVHQVAIRAITSEGFRGRLKRWLPIHPYFGSEKRTELEMADQQGMWR